MNIFITQDKSGCISCYRSGVTDTLWLLGRAEPRVLEGWGGSQRDRTQFPWDKMVNHGDATENRIFRRGGGAVMLIRGSSVLYLVPGVTRRGTVVQ